MNLILQKKKENISEYLIKLYQTEDLIRSYELDLDRIYANIIVHLPVEEEEKMALRAWYKELLEEMKEKGLEVKGHVAEITDLLLALEQLHLELYKLDKNYKPVYEKAAEDIQKHIDLSEGLISNPVEVCLNTVYGYMLLRLDGGEVDDELNTRIQNFGEVLSYLSYRYKIKQTLDSVK
ncbi:DUF4924 family protein [Rapidithrix thailandica]|uniref:DUF4924 family protein n=1 Tax=Rapidithrix thailandica TaxID=413964 RepID=A0AAW9SIC6_9BACT